MSEIDNANREEHDAWADAWADETSRIPTVVKMTAALASGLVLLFFVMAVFGNTLEERRSDAKLCDLACKKVSPLSHTEGFERGTGGRYCICAFTAPRD